MFYYKFPVGRERTQTLFEKSRGSEVPGVLAVLFSPAEAAVLAVMSQKGLWCMRPAKQKVSHESARDFAMCWNM